jgi:hypothetical protein
MSVLAAIATPVYRVGHGQQFTSTFHSWSTRPGTTRPAVTHRAASAV